MAFTIADVPTIQDVLGVLYSHHGYSNQRLARLARIDEDHMSRVRSGQRKISVESLQELSVALCADGVTDIGGAFYTPDYVVCLKGKGRPDGSLATEALAKSKHFGDLANAFDAGNKRACRTASSYLRSVLDDIDREIDRLPD